MCACSGGTDHSPSVAAGKTPSDRLPPSLFSFSLFLVSEYEVIVIGCRALATQPADVCISVHMSTSERTRSAGGMPSWSKQGSLMRTVFMKVKVMVQLFSVNVSEIVNGEEKEPA